MLHLVLAVLAAPVAPAAGDPLLPPPVTDEDFRPATPEQVELGRMLFYDKELSGNRNISCGTCHHSLTDTGDGLSLPVGEGGRGLGMTRDVGSGAERIHERVPRNAPPVFNLGARQVTTMFHDGRVAEDPQHPDQFLSPAGPQLPDGLHSVLAVQAMFPVTSAAEMAGQAGENPIADAGAAGNLGYAGGVWEQLGDRLRAIPGYVELFLAAYPNEIESADDITYVHAANAIAAFEGTVWRATNSPFDRFLAGQKRAMSKQAQQGMKLFYGSAGCSSCHSGVFQSDEQFYAIAMPQFGPGKGHGAYGYEDYGRGAVTGAVRDRYRFRTPPLRNVALTGPWGHDGAYDTLDGIVRHHLDPVWSLLNYDEDQCVLPPARGLSQEDFLPMQDPNVVSAIAAANELEPMALTEDQIDLLMEFLLALTDPASLDLRKDVPFSVPSGLPVAD
jgi:cytochrome c peroxidase